MPARRADRRRNTQKIDCRLRVRDATVYTTAQDPRTTALTTPAHEAHKEVSAVANTITTDTQHAGFGMPSVGRSRVAALRGLPVTTGVDRWVAGDTCALRQDIADYRSVMTDATVKGAFPGASAWSPPI